MPMLRHLWLVVLSVFVLAAPVYGQSVSTPMVQPPQLDRPEVGSVAGTMAAFSLGAGDLTRGIPSLPLLVQLPKERGACPVQILPTYSAEAGVSEWGQGFTVELAVRRARDAGHLTYLDDQWTSPWGKLVQGNDGALYPLGFSTAVRLRATEQGFHAVDAQGTRFVFARSESTARGVYAYWLTEVHGVAGEHAELRYTTHTSGRLYVESVRYGSRGAPFAQRVSFEYEPLPGPLHSFVSGERRTLDRRIARIRVGSRAHAGAPYVDRYRYDLAHELGFGPAPRLVSLTRVWPDGSPNGSSEPPVRYRYAHAFSHLEGATLSRVPGVENVLSEFGTALLNPARATWFDVDDDGVLDFEHGAEQTLGRNTQSGFVIERLLPQTPVDEARSICRPAPSLGNAPRRLAWLERSAGQPQVVVTLSLAGRTRIVVCDRDGSSVRHDAYVEGLWPLGDNTFLIDIDGDQRADLVRVRQNLVATLLARGEPLHFEPGPATTLSPRTTLTDLTFRDFNGDGIADLVGRTRTSIAVWFGTGQGRFAPELVSFFVYGDGARLQDISSFQFSYGDLDGDGLSDLVAVRSSAVYVFANDGTALRSVSVPDVADRLLDLKQPLFADFRYGGESELTFVRGNALWSLPLRHADTGLLTEVDDGRGAMVRFRYARGPTAPGVGGAARVLAEVVRESPARGTWTTRYDYDGPRIHPVARFLLGFTHVRRDEAWGVEESRFEQRVDTPPALLERVQSSADHVALMRFERRRYELASTKGVVFLRPQHSEHGYASADGHTTLTDQTDFLRYERGLCATEWLDKNAFGTVRSQVVLSAPSALHEALHCLPEVETWSARHADASLDVDMTRTIVRNSQGWPSQVSWLQGDGSQLVTETIRYDELGRLLSVANGSGQETVARYDPASGRLIALEEATGVISRVAAFDPQTLAITALRIERDQQSFLEQFAYDGWERLERTWNDVAGTTRDLPSARHLYLLGDRSHLGRVETERSVDPGASSRSASLVDAAGEAVATAQRIPEGWVLDNLTIRDLGERLTRTWRAPQAVQSLDDPLALAAGAVEIDRHKQDAFEQLAERVQRLQEHVTRSVVGSLTWQDAELTSTRTENGRERTIRTYDASLRLLSLTDEREATTRFAYDALGRLIGVTLPDGTGHERRFDGLGRVRLVERDRVGGMRYEYDPRTGLLADIAYLDADGESYRSEHLAYDTQGRLGTVDAQSERGVERVVRTYDGDGKSGQTGFLTEERSDGFVRTISYYPDGKVRERREELTGFRTLRSAFVYTQGGQHKRITRSIERDGAILEEHTQAFDYDGFGRVASLDVDGTRLATFSYDAWGRLDHATLAGGRMIVPSYDAVVGELSGLSVDRGDWVSETRVELNDRGQLARELRATPRGDDWVQYDYDARGQLKLAQSRGHSEHYSYDLAGRPTTAHDRVGDRAITTGDAPAKLDWLSYDRAGRLSTRGDTHFVYGPRGQLSEVLRAGRVTQYVYDADGARVLKHSEGQPMVAYLSGGVHGGWLCRAVSCRRARRGRAARLGADTARYRSARHAFHP